MTIKEIIQKLHITMTDASGQESHFESWLTLNDGIIDAIDALKALDKQEPVAWMSEDEREAFERFNETCEDGEGYDVPKTMMRRLAEIGVIHHTSRGIYGITKFGRLLVGNTILPQRTKQEPVAFASHGVINWIADKQFQHEADLYTTPPQHESTCAECDKNQSDGWALYCVDCLREFYKHDPTNKRTWVGLTDDEIYKIAVTLEGEHWKKIADAIEAKLRSKNNG